MYPIFFYCFTRCVSHHRPHGIALHTKALQLGGLVINCRKKQVSGIHPRTSQGLLHSVNLKSHSTYVEGNPSRPNHVTLVQLTLSQNLTEDRLLTAVLCVVWSRAADTSLNYHSLCRCWKNPGVRTNSSSLLLTIAVQTSAPNQLDKISTWLVQWWRYISRTILFYCAWSLSSFFLFLVQLLHFCPLFFYIILWQSVLVEQMKLMVHTFLKILSNVLSLLGFFFLSLIRYLSNGTKKIQNLFLNYSNLPFNQEIKWSRAPQPMVRGPLPVFIQI